MPPLVRAVSCVVHFAGVQLADVLGARGQVVADSGWPICSVFCIAKPTTGNEENDLDVIAGAGNNVTRFTGRVRRFRPSGFPKSIELVCMGTLAYANEWVQAETIEFLDVWPDGATDQQLVAWALSFVPGVSYDAGDIAGTGVLLGLEAPEAFDWRADQTAWNYIQRLDRATLYRTYQDSSGTIRRVRMIGHPDATPDFTLAPADMLDGASGSRDTERTRNFVRVLGHDYGADGEAFAEVAESNDFQGDGSNPATRHVEEFESPLIESGLEEDGTWDGNAGLRADQIAAQVMLDVNKEFVEASIPSWRDALDGPGQTVLVDALARLAIGEPMWLQSYMWEVGEQGWRATYGLTGGGEPVTSALARAVV